ncbi:MAG: hypothetical protein AB8B78_13575 [Polaribacter sp.]
MQKERKYWSCIKKNTNFYDLPKESQIDILVKSGVYIAVNVASSPKLNVKKGVLYLPDLNSENKPSQELKSEFYEYILEIYQADIDNYFYIFFKDFNDRVYGMEQLEQKAIAREIFREIYNIVDISVSFLKKEISKNGVENLMELNRFQKLKALRSGLCSTLATYETLIAYLGGNEDYFKSTEFLEDEAFKKTVTFEGYLKVLISLNDRYQFEEDAVFSKLGILKETYKRYENIFVNFDVYQFTHNFIENLEENKPSNIDSLHQALLELNLISNIKETFINYINIEHKIPITKVRNYARDVNRLHDFRVKKFLEKLKNLTSEN